MNLSVIEVRMTKLVDWILMRVVHWTSCWVSNMSETYLAMRPQCVVLWAQCWQCLHLSVHIHMSFVELNGKPHYSVIGSLSFRCKLTFFCLSIQFATKYTIYVSIQCMCAPTGIPLSATSKLEGPVGSD